jgi:hypothetical protein
VEWYYRPAPRLVKQRPYKAIPWVGVWGGLGGFGEHGSASHSRRATYVSAGTAFFFLSPRCSIPFLTHHRRYCHVNSPCPGDDIPPNTATPRPHHLFSLHAAACGAGWSSNPAHAWWGRGRLDQHVSESCMPAPSTCPASRRDGLVVYSPRRIKAGADDGYRAATPKLQ